MAATLAGLLKQYIEAQGLSISAYRDQAPQGAALPYCVIYEGISAVPDGLNDGTEREMVQVDLWQQRQALSADDADKEDPSLKPKLVQALHGAMLPGGEYGTPARHVYGVVVRNSIRKNVGQDVDTNLVGHAITLEVFQAL